MTTMFVAPSAARVAAKSRYAPENEKSSIICDIRGSRQPGSTAGHEVAQAPHHLLRAFGDHFHHFLRLLELVQQLVHFLDGYTGACGDPPLARGLQELGLHTLLRRHRVDDALEARHTLFVERRTLRCPGDLRRQLVDERREAAHLAHLLDLRLEIVEVEALAALDLLGELLRLF